MLWYYADSMALLSQPLLRNYCAMTIDCCGLALAVSSLAIIVSVSPLLARS